MSKVDVIIPFFNTPIIYVRAAIDSLLAQTVKDWEAIIIDDASSPANAGEMRSLLDSYKDIRFTLIRTDHKGPAGSRNAGIEISNSPLIAFLDSDDIWYPEKLARQIAALEANTDVGLVHGNYQFVNADGSPIRTDMAKGFLNGLSSVDLFAEMLKENYVATSSVVLRRQLGAQVGFFDNSFPCIVDKDLWLRLLSQGCLFWYDSAVLIDYRMHSSNISKRVDILRSTRIKLISKVDELIKANPSLQAVGWKPLKKQMIRHTYIEASEGYLEKNDYREALRYSLPHYSGLSLRAGFLAARSLYRWLCAA